MREKQKKSATALSVAADQQLGGVHPGPHRTVDQRHMSPKRWDPRWWVPLHGTRHLGPIKCLPRGPPSPRPRSTEGAGRGNGPISAAREEADLRAYEDEVDDEEGLDGEESFQANLHKSVTGVGSMYRGRSRGRERSRSPRYKSPPSRPPSGRSGPEPSAPRKVSRERRGKRALDSQAQSDADSEEGERSSRDDSHSQSEDEDAKGSKMKTNYFEQSTKNFTNWQRSMNKVDSEMQNSIHALAGALTENVKQLGDGPLPSGIEMLVNHALLKGVIAQGVCNAKAVPLPTVEDPMGICALTLSRAHFFSCHLPSPSPCPLAAGPEWASSRPFPPPRRRPRSSRTWRVAAASTRP